MSNRASEEWLRVEKLTGRAICHSRNGVIIQYNTVNELTATILALFELNIIQANMLKMTGEIAGDSKHKVHADRSAISFTGFGHKSIKT